MSELAEKLLEQAVRPPPDDRARAAERLLSTLEPELSGMDQLRAQEAEDRLNAFERGEIGSV